MFLLSANAGPEPRPEGGAQRTLEGVGSSPSLGEVLARTLRLPPAAHREPYGKPTLTQLLPTIVRGLQRSGLLLPEEAPSDRLIHWHFRPTDEDIGNPGRVLRDHWQSAGPAGLRFGSGLQKELGEPTGDRMDHAVMPVMVFCVCVPGHVPILMAEQVIPQHADIPQREAHPLAKGMVGRGGGISNQRDAHAVGVRDPPIRSVKRGQRADGSCSREERSRSAGLHRLFDQARDIPFPLQAMRGRCLIREVRADATLALGKQGHRLTEVWVE
jgi:hypothetical protein